MNKRQTEVEKAKLAAEAQELKHLKAIYNKAAEDIAKNISITDGKIEVMLQEWDRLSDDDKSVYRSKIYQKNFQKQLQSQINGILKDLNSGQYSSIDEYLKKCYETGYIGTMYDIAGQGIPIISPIDQKKVIRAMKTNSKISSGLYTKLGEDVEYLKKRIANNISRGIATSDSYENIARNIASDSNVGMNNAMRIARTEGHRIHSNSAHDAQLAAKDAGADIVKQWDSTMDGKTRSTHRLLDGQIREVEEPFEMGGKKAMYPSGFGRPEEDINCRCALLQRATWALDDDELEALKEKAKFHEIYVEDDDKEAFRKQKDIDFNTFKKRYLKAMNGSAKSSKALDNSGKDVKMDLKKNHNTELAQKFGTEYYDDMHQKIVDSPDQKLAMVWKKYEADIKVGDANYKGHEHCMGSRIYLNGKRDAKGSSWQAPYQVTFHEAGHAIDNLAKSHPSMKHSKGVAFHYSALYKDGLFPQTIKDEVADIVKAKDKELKALFKEHKGDVEWLHTNGFISDWKYSYYKENGVWIGGEPKYAKSYAYSVIEKEIKNIDSKLAMSDLSDIMEGATGGKIACGFGHGKTYWKNRTFGGVADGLATEAFAEMIDSTFANPESLAVIKKWLPKSYAVFQEMIENLLK